MVLIFNVKTSTDPLWCSCPQFTDFQEQTLSWIQCEVIDTGVGIPSQELESIFDAFVQSQIGKVFSGGTGLGLTISRNLTELLRGELSVESILGKGSIFRIKIPVKIVDHFEEKPTKHYDYKISLAPDQKNYRVLVVDDHLENRQLMVKWMQKLGLEVQEAIHGQQAIEIWQQWQPDLMWMDIGMPILDGYQATEQIRSQVGGEKPVIIALSAHVTKRDRGLALQVGCNDFISKPFREEILLEKMNQHLGLRFIDNVNPINLPRNRVVLNPEQFNVMPLTWLHQLSKLAQLGSDELLLKHIKEIPEEYNDLITGLQDLVKNFKYEKIFSLVESVLNPKPENTEI